MSLFSLSEMESLVRANLNASEEEVLTSAEIRKALNDGYKDVSRLAGCIENHDVVSTVSGDRFVPYDAHRVNFVYYGTTIFVGGGGGGSEPGGGGNPSEGGWVGGGDDSDGWTENLCLSSSIAYTTLQMTLNQVQTLSVSDSNEGVVYTWAIISGGGTLSAISGTSITYTAPASNPGCANNATITLSAAGNICDTITIATATTVDYKAMAYYDSAYGCTFDSGNHCLIHAIIFNCSGVDWHEINPAEAHTSSQCHEPGLEGDPVCRFPITCLNTTCTIPGAPQSGEWVDIRTPAMIAAGCCPANLL